MAARNRKPATPTRPKGPGHGGARANAGRKPDAAKKAIADFNAATQAKLVDWLPRLLANLKLLADGGYERVEETFEASEPVVISFGDPGKQPKKVEAELVVKKRVVSTAEPDRLANEYLINRLLGKPTEWKELSGPDGGAIPFEEVVARVWDEESEDES